MILGGCQGLSVVEGSLAGDPLEISAVRGAAWTIKGFVFGGFGVVLEGFGEGFGGFGGFGGLGDQCCSSSRFWWFWGVECCWRL